jgi:hypothetical protein
VGPEEGASVGPEEGATVGPDEGMSAGSSEDPSRVGPKDGIAESSVDSEGKPEGDAVGAMISPSGGTKNGIKEGKVEALRTDDGWIERVGSLKG